MVAKIKTPVHVKRPLHYNENKVKEGVAELLHVSGFLKDAPALSFTDKLARFEQLQALNTRAKTNALHISLNFDKCDQLHQDKLVEIARMYMDKIGFAKQPYLVYQHFDAAHPHVHIVTSTIQPDGRRINTYNIGKDKSEPARKEIEQLFGLTVAEGRVQQRADQGLAAARAMYGKAETRKAITNVLDAVLNTYKYTTLGELNAILGAYNVRAERGDEQSRTYKHGGLLYRVLDQYGNAIGVPIKASLIYSKPTLKKLKEQFAKNTRLSMPFKRRVKSAVDFVFHGSSISSAEQLAALLGEQQIKLVAHKNKEGRVYGVSYVDFKTRCAFNGSTLGKSYSAEGLTERLRTNAQSVSVLPTLDHVPSAGDSISTGAMIDALFSGAEQEERTAFELLHTRKKKKKKGKHI